jgi:Protein of unknown function (DUF1573)
MHHAPCTMQRFLALILLAPSFVFAEDPVPQIVEVANQTGASSVPAGDIKLGNVLAGSVVSVTFKVKNLSDRELEFASVSPSCKCTEISLPSAKIAPRAILAQTANVRVKIPDVRAKNLTIAGILVKTSTGSQAAVLRIKANIHRALFIPTQESAFTLDSAEDFETSLALDLDTKIDPSQIQIQSAADNAEFSIVRTVTGEWPCKLLIKGKRARLLESPRFTVEISLPTENIRDLVRLQFYDGTLVRAIPATPKIVSGKASFILIRKEGVDPNRLRIRNSEGVDLQATYRQRTKSLLDVCVQGLGEANKCVMIISDDGQFEFLLTAEKENDDD